jgi:hypothetical protein
VLERLGDVERRRKRVDDSLAVEQLENVVTAGEDLVETDEAVDQLAAGVSSTVVNLLPHLSRVVG